MQGFAMTHAGDDVGTVANRYLHPSTTAKALLPTPEFSGPKYLVDVQDACGNAGKKSREALSVRFSRR